jgi:hypothetical protein
MGFFKKVFRPVRKIAKKIIPKEVRPFLPYIAAAFGPATAGLTGTAFAKAATQKALLAAATSAATDEQGDPLRAGLLAITPDITAKGLGSAGRALGNVKPDSKFAQFLTSKGTGLEATLANPSFMDSAKVIGGQTAIDQSAKFAEIRQDEIDAYNANLLEQGVQDKTKRRAAIFGIYKNAGYDDDYVNSMLDRYGYESGGRIGFANGGYRGKAEAAMGLTTMKDLLKGKTKAPIIEIDEDKEVVLGEDDDDDDRPIIREKPNYAQAMKDAMTGVEAAFGIPFAGVEASEFKRFARGGEVEIEEETDDLGIMDLMRDQGIEYGEQVSNAQNDEILERLFEEFLDMGLSPEDAAKAARDAFDRMSQKSGDGIMQMASGYKTDIEEMYEQYVFEMEEQGLQPMSFSQFLARERAGMEDGGKVKRRRKGEPADEIIETEEEIFIDKMPKPKRQGIMEAADGGIMEKDMRGGGFIPEGTKERADDVPARLSKNEFVMTADAVRAAGGGSVNKGAKRMYDMMYGLEGKV